MDLALVLSKTPPCFGSSPLACLLGCNCNHILSLPQTRRNNEWQLKTHTTRNPICTSVKRTGQLNYCQATRLIPQQSVTDVLPQSCFRPPVQSVNVCSSDLRKCTSQSCPGSRRRRKLFTDRRWQLLVLTVGGPIASISQEVILQLKLHPLSMEIVAEADVTHETQVRLHITNSSSPSC